MYTSRLLRRALVGLLLAVGLMTGLMAVAAPDQSYQLVQGVINLGAARRFNRSLELTFTVGQPVAPSWSTDGQRQMVSGFWSRDAFLMATPTPRPTPVYDKQLYVPLVAIRQSIPGASPTARR